jgi:hypothetical protein
MTDIVTSDVIHLAKWHENEAVRLRKHPDADMTSTHGLAEMHGETASTLYMLLADRNAAIMDANMQAREAGNMEYNARVLMTERDEAKADLELQRWCLAVARRDRDRAMAGWDQERADREEWMRQHAALDELCTRREAERDQLREAVEALMAADDYWLRGNKDNQWASMMAAARAKARIALGKDR